VDKPAKPVRVVSYLRVSTTEQADSGLGVDAQRIAVSAEVSRRGWAEVAEKADLGASGKGMTGRAGLQEALAMLASGEADALVVAKLDRLSRSLLDFANLMALARRQGWNLIALDLGIDLTTPAGEFMAGVMASAAQWERRIIGQRTKDALAVRKAEGVRLGRPPSIDPVIVDRIVTSYTSGNSMAEIARTLNAEGVPTARGRGTWYPSTIQTVLRRTTSTSAV
jgi:DNA invertase Pin-like site-specific DNA recombinase